MNRIINSNIAVDMGGKYTGVISYTTNSSLAVEDINAYIITMPDQGNGINYTVKERTATRHRIRSLDRYKKARKLIYQILAYAIKRDLESSEKEAISSIIKRRGYTRLEVELDLSIISVCPTEFFADNLISINNDSPLEEQFTKLTSSVETCEEFLQELNKIDWESKYKLISDKNERSTYKSAVSEMKKALSSMIEQEKYGHKHRKQYLEAIQFDIKKDSRLKSLCELIGGAEKLFKCIGNISNLQLRSLRWYFNDISMKESIIFKPEKFKDVWIRAYQFFHYQRKEEIVPLLTDLAASKNIVETLCTIDPLRTIPPYEDQNNRNPPIDQTLLLSPEALDKNYPNKWEKWVELLTKEKPEVADGIDDIVKLTDRKSRKDIKKASSYTQNKIKNSYILQRLLDLSKTKAPICNLRSWSKDPLAKQNIEVNELIERVLSAESDLFLKLASSYYRECDYAKRGLWSIVENPLLEISGIHPPLKNKSGVLERIIQSVLCLDNSAQFDFNKFTKEIWNQKVKGNSTIKSLCKKIEEQRKLYGNFFKTEYNKAIKQNENKKKLTKEQEELIKISDSVQLVADFISNKLGLSELDIPKYSNPYSLAQLYTIIETDTHGFSSNCLAVIKENSWRMQSYNHSGAICSRLVAETVRPFDGSLGKILERQDFEIAKRKAHELISLPDLCNSHINLGILIESNQFEFSASIAKIKQSNKLKKIQAQAKKAQDRQESLWLSKNERIIKMANNICAYTGVSLDSIPCEIDHIIPRSFTKASMGTIFNSEANLIYVSQNGNQLKKERLLTINDLHPNYLNAVFGTNDINLIKNKIENVVECISLNNSKFIIELMTEDEIQCVRHALFLQGSKAYYTVINALSTQYSTRVNGTQAWFVREIIRKTKTLLNNWLQTTNNSISFETWKINASESHATREELSKCDSRFTKKEIQPITSHAIDALCIFASACDDKRKSEFLGKNGSLDFISKPEILSKLIPTSYEICDISRQQFSNKKNPESRKLYKETIYAEHFLPIMVLNDIVKIGFNWNSNNYELKKGTKEFIELISPYLKEKLQPKNHFFTYHIDKNKAFELIHNVYSGKLPNMREAVKCLEALRYTTLKTDILSAIYDSKKHTFKTESEIAKKFEFEIKSGSFPKWISISKGKLVFPAINDWLSILSLFDHYKGQKVNEDDLLIREKLLSNKKTLGKLKHRPVKKALSLPMLSSPSGGIRIKRKNLDKKDIYQLVAANTPETVTTQGFLLDNNKIDWNVSVGLPIYSQKSLTSTDPNCCTPNEKEFVSMNEKRLVYKSDSITVMMSPGTKDRRYIHIEQTFDSFIRCLDSTTISSYLDLPNEIVLKDNECKLFGKNLSELIEGNIDIGIPRGKIVIELLGKTISYYYSVSSSNAKMNQAFEST